MSEAVFDLDTQSHADLETKDENFDPKALAVISQNGSLAIIEASSLSELKEELKKFHPEVVVAVWKGKKLPIKKEYKLTF